MGDQGNDVEAHQTPPLNRRAFIQLGGQALVLVGLGGLVHWMPAQDTFLRPPGALPEREFLALCIKCQRCREVCPLRAISPVLLTESIAAVGTPKLDFRRGYCDLCMECVEVCATGALAPVAKETLTLGVARVIEDECIAWVWRGCTRCYDVCPLEAIVLDDLKRPTVDAGKCNGCGLCEFVCPTSSFRSYTGSGRKAIVVEPIGATES